MLFSEGYENKFKFKSEPHIDSCTKNFISELLQIDPAQRLGAEGKDVKAHPFFKGTDWRAVEALQLKPPFLPSIRFGFHPLLNRHYHLLLFTFVFILSLLYRAARHRTRNTLMRNTNSRGSTKRHTKITTKIPTETRSKDSDTLQLRKH